jgi:hypothetical protein
LNIDASDKKIPNLDLKLKFRNARKKNYHHDQKSDIIDDIINIS